MLLREFLLHLELCDVILVDHGSAFFSVTHVVELLVWLQGVDLRGATFYFCVIRACAIFAARHQLLLVIVRCSADTERGVRGRYNFFGAALATVLAARPGFGRGRPSALRLRVRPLELEFFRAALQRIKDGALATVGAAVGLLVLAVELLDLLEIGALHLLRAGHLLHGVGIVPGQSLAVFSAGRAIEMLITLVHKLASRRLRVSGLFIAFLADHINLGSDYTLERHVRLVRRV